MNTPKSTSFGRAHPTSPAVLVLLVLAVRVAVLASALPLQLCEVVCLMVKVTCVPVVSMVTTAIQRKRTEPDLKQKTEFYPYRGYTQLDSPQMSKAISNLGLALAALFFGGLTIALQHLFDSCNLVNFPDVGGLLTKDDCAAILDAGIVRYVFVQPWPL